MTFHARDYQDALIDQVRVKLRTNRRVLVQLPTGGGKTVVGGKMIESAAGKGHRCLFTVHRRELIEQTVDTFNDVGIRHGVIASGRPYQVLERVQVASIDTLKHRINKGANLFPPKFIMVDEAHHVGAAGWKSVLDAYPDSYVVGLSATPERLDGKGLDDVFEDLVVGPSTGWLISNGYLCDYRAFAPGGGPDLGGVHVARGDYVKGELSAAMDKPTITGDAIAHYQKLASGQSAVCFCASIEHSEHVAQQFRNAGVMAWHLDGGTPYGERQEAIRAFRNGEIKVLCNVDLFGEGFDLPSLVASILLRPTQSLALYLQQVGRALRTSPGKKRALILDHAGNIARHGLPDEERQWSLRGRDKRAKKAGSPLDARQCPRCFALHRPRPSCPECGHLYDTAAREVEQVDGELREIDVVERRNQAAAEQRAARSVEELIDLGRRRGYRNPEAWAAHVYSARAAGVSR